ncbi:MAG: UDP-N-acetylmuramoyl-L-alanine--D-glutamate ligase [Candidatus Electryonea clarkiae]|nr:UDP-N-acetylmuramoyl-L-alanine--D-glutamate ligase [Candidatus Electryonea clarkiae]
MNPMPEPLSLAEKNIWVIGLAGSGMAAARLLKKADAKVFITENDDNSLLRERAEKLRDLGIEVQTGGHNFEGHDLPAFAVLSPGVPLNSPVVESLRNERYPVYSEIEIAQWFFKGKIIGITGSNGKTTVTAWMEYLLREAGYDAVAAGNIGYPFCDLVREKPETRYAIVEISSYQLETIKWFHPHISVFTNITPDHLLRHGNMEAYAEAKARIWKNQITDDWAVLPCDDESVMRMAESIHPGKFAFSFEEQPGHGVFLKEGQIVIRDKDDLTTIINLEELQIPGIHNVANAMSVSAAAWKLGLKVEEIKSGLAGFSGVPHRLEIVHDNGRTWINDSKSTNVESLRVALEAMEDNVWLIAGGQDKGDSYKPLIENVKNKVSCMLLIGEGSGRIAVELGEYTRVIQCGTLEKAVKTASKEAGRGATVLLSPACASFDQFMNFEDRGDHFRQMIRETIK